MQWVETERFRYEAYQVVLAEKAPWLSVRLPSWQGAFGLLMALLFVSSALGSWSVLTAGLAGLGGGYGLCVLIRREIKVCPRCYEQVAGGGHGCRCGFYDHQRS